MTVLPITSQKRLIVKEDTFICYTNIENRIIALYMLQGERDSISLGISDSLLNIYQSASLSYDSIIDNSDSIIHSQDSVINIIISDYDKIAIDNNKLKDKNSKLKKHKIYLSGLSLLLILIIL